MERIEFISMLKEAVEIQNQWNFEKGDYFTTIKQLELDGSICLLDDFWLNDELTKKKIRTGHRDPWIWIPRLDQLVKMLDFSGTMLIGHIPGNMLMLNLKYQKEEGYYKGHTLEELILLAIMEWKFSKTWDGVTFNFDYNKEKISGRH